MAASSSMSIWSRIRHFGKVISIPPLLSLSLPTPTWVMWSVQCVPAWRFWLVNVPSWPGEAGRGRGEGGAVGRSYSHSTGTTRSHTCRLHLTLPAPPPPFVRSYSGGPRPRSQGSGSLDGVRCQAADRQLCQFTRKSIRFDTVAF